MIKEFKPPQALRDKTFLSSKAGRASGVPLSTVQVWTEKKLVFSSEKKTTGTGVRREYTVLDCIEIGIVKSLSSVRLPIPYIKKVMDDLRKGTPLTLKQALGYKKAFLIIRFYASNGDEYYGASCVSNEKYGPRKAKLDKNGNIIGEERSFEQYWQDATTPMDKKFAKTLIVDLKHIERRVVNALLTEK